MARSSSSPESQGRRPTRGSNTTPSSMSHLLAKLIWPLTEGAEGQWRSRPFFCLLYTSPSPRDRSLS
eukprot:4018372-Pyramimonas_sp.AAC.1